MVYKKGGCIMISNDITDKFALELADLDFSVQEYIVLRGELEDNEIKEVDNIKNTKDKILKLFELLNQKQRLPEEYQNRVKDYKGFKGPKINFDIHI